MKRLIRAISPRWMRSKTNDRNHPHFRRSTRTYLKARRKVQNCWLCFLSVAIVLPLPVVLWLVALPFLGFLSLVFLDESRL